MSSISIIGTANMDVFIAATTTRPRRTCRRSSSAWECALDTGQLSMARALENATLLHVAPVAHSVKHTNF